MSESELNSVVRVRVLEFLIESAQQLEVPPIVKYSALSLFADRFYRSLSGLKQSNGTHWLLRPIRESNLQLFALSSIWISSKMHNSHPLSVRKLKHLGDKIIQEQHFTTRDFVEAEVIFVQVLDFEIGTSNVAFSFLEELLIQLKGVAKVGKHVNFETCLDIMDLLYEKEETSILYSSPCSLAASVLVASYVITVPKQKWEFPLLPWGCDIILVDDYEETLPIVYVGGLSHSAKKSFKSFGLLVVPDVVTGEIRGSAFKYNFVVKFVTSYKEEEIEEIVRDILEHVLEPSSMDYKSTTL